MLVILLRLSGRFRAESAQMKGEEQLGAVIFHHILKLCLLNQLDFLTGRHTVVANSDKGGLDREAAGQAAQHGLNRVAF